MSLYDYQRSLELERDDSTPFYALIMAAMRRADTDNAELLKATWPEVWTELQQRYHAPGGLLAGERGEVGRCVACDGSGLVEFETAASRCSACDGSGRTQ